MKWIFEEKRRQSKARNPMQESFFSNQSIDGGVHALVREAIQNSLDAALGGQIVRVRFYLGELATNTSALQDYFPAEAWEHFTANDSGLKIEPSLKNESCKYLVVEDFNTTGLIGDINASESEGKNAFYHFLRAEAQSGKEDGNRGRHGIGKFTFPYNSMIRTFFVLSVRDEEPKKVLCGQAVLKNHTVNGKGYTPDSWWGKHESDGFGMPLTDSENYDKFKKDFCIARGGEDNGLSIVVPYISSDVDLKSIVENVCKEYFWAIISSELEVFIESEDENIEINSNTIKSLNLASISKEISERLSFAQKISDGLYDVEYNFIINSPSSPSWKNFSVDEVSAKEINSVLSSENGLVKFTCPIFVQKTGSVEYEKCNFSVYVSSYDEKLNELPIVIREGITIPDPRLPKIRGYRTLTVINSGALGSLLGDSENPAHTEWEKNSEKFKNKYKWGAKTIDFVRSAHTRVLSLLKYQDDEGDANILSDIFFVDYPGDGKLEKSKSKETKGNNKVNNKPKIDLPPKVKSYEIQISKGGFVIKGTLNGDSNLRIYTVKIAYDIWGKSSKLALEKHSSHDFDLTKFSMKSCLNFDGCEIKIKDKNTLLISPYTNEFVVSFSGFDLRRDLVVDVNSKKDVMNENV